MLRSFSFSSFFFSQLSEYTFSYATGSHNVSYLGRSYLNFVFSVQMKFIIQTSPRCHLIVHFLPIQVIFTTRKPWTLLSNIFSTDSIWVKDFSLSFLRFFISSSIQFFLNFIALDPFQVILLEKNFQAKPTKNTLER